MTTTTTLASLSRPRGPLCSRLQELPNHHALPGLERAVPPSPPTTTPRAASRLALLPTSSG
eukprot:4640761-Alexandrium_andersonii.AAC.1